LLSSRLLKSVVLGPALLALPFLAGCDRQSDDQVQPRPSAGPSDTGTIKPTEAAGTLDRSKKGTPLPEFTAKDPAGKELALSSLAGKPVLVNLWATWCAPCIAELPTLEKLAATHEGKLDVLTISQDMGDPAKVQHSLSSRKLVHLKPWLDQQGDLAFRYDAQTLPMTILYDAAGKELWRFSGGRDWTTAESAALIAEAGIK